MPPALLHPLIVGHRGMTGRAENSLEAFAAAIALGVDAVEFDVRRTADGRLVAWHDERLPSGELLSAITARHARETVPHLALVREVAESCADSGVTLQIDLKEIGGEVESVAEVERVVGAGRLFVTTLEDVSVRALKRARPDLRVGLSLGAGRPGDTWLRRGLEIVPWRRVSALRRRPAVGAAPAGLPRGLPSGARPRVPGLRLDRGRPRADGPPAALARPDGPHLQPARPGPRRPPAGPGPRREVGRP